MLGSVLITGGTGSFGRAMARRLLAVEKPDRIIILSRGEHQQETMERELAPLDPDIRMRYRIGDVRDPARLEMAMRGVDCVIHAAAMKVVPKCEADPFEAVRTNILGAQNVIEASLRAGVGRVVALSTDKCVSPANLYGATKLCAEKLFAAANVYAGGLDTKCAIVRYGNVAGSQGSVIPLWQGMLAAGKKAVPVTNPFATRYWLTLDEAVEMVLWTLENMKGGEIVVPNMPAYQVSDLAQAVGAVPDIIGLRPGEKIHEQMISEHEMHGFVSLGEYWVSGSALVPDGLEIVRLAQPLSSGMARRMSVEEIRSRLGELGFAKAEAA